MQVKGRSLKQTLDYLREKFGQQKLLSFLDKYQEFEAINSCSDIDWYPIETFISVLEKADSYFGYCDLSLLEEMGNYTAKKSFESSHKLFTGMKPATLFTNAPMIFSTYYSNGSAQAEFIKDTRVKLTLNNFPCSPHLSRRILGWSKGVIALTGGKNVKGSELPCKNGLSFIFEWNN